MRKLTIASFTRNNILDSQSNYVNCTDKKYLTWCDNYLPVQIK